MADSVNIIIPSIKIDNELIKCLNNVNKLKYKNFIVTIVLDEIPKKSLKKFKFKINKMIVGKVNMSKKRNMAVKKFKSKFIAFLDSDACPTAGWLTNATGHLSDKKIHIVGL